MDIRETKDTNDADWILLRSEFIPELNPREHRNFLQAFARDSAGFSAFIATDQRGRAVAFAEVSIRRDYVNGCRHRPALFLEGIFVQPGSRGQGIGRLICETAEQWGRNMGCREFASDVYVDDYDSLAAHTGLGFNETERVVYFRKPIFPDQ